jgi:hypothetical protein
MRHWERHLTATANGINNRSKTHNNLHQSQRIPAKVAAPLSILGDDMPDNEDADAKPAKRWNLNGPLLSGSFTYRPRCTTPS